MAATRTRNGRSRARATPAEPVDSYHPDIEWEVNEKEHQLRGIDRRFPTRVQLIELLAEDLRSEHVESRHTRIDGILMLAEDLQTEHSQAKGINAMLPSLKTVLARQNAAE